MPCLREEEEIFLHCLKLQMKQSMFWKVLTVKYNENLMDSVELNEEEIVLLFASEEIMMLVNTENLKVAWLMPLSALFQLISTNYWPLW